MNPLSNQPSSTMHFLAESEGTLADFLKSQLEITEAALDHIFLLGSVFINKRRVFSDQILRPHDYVRVHAYPKRYPVQNVEWRSTIQFENEAFLVINKPAGVPVHATLDNSIENVAYQLSQTLGYPLYVTQRLDVPVSGLLLLAKTPNFQSEFNRFLRQKRVTKRYRALTQNEPKAGLYTHYMEKSPWAPKNLFCEPSENRQECQLEIIKTTRFGDLFESEIHLLTGRTHQIRAQLSYIGSPILGDLTYGGEIGAFSVKEIGLHSSFLAFKDFEFISVPKWTEV